MKVRQRPDGDARIAVRWSTAAMNNLAVDEEDPHPPANTGGLLFAVRRRARGPVSVKESRLEDA